MSAATTPTCTVEGCDHSEAAKGLCWGHYARRRRGSTNTGPIRQYPARTTDLPHGRGRYNHRSIKCRCGVCTTANAEHQRLCRERDGALHLLNEVMWPAGEVDGGWLVVGEDGEADWVTVVEDMPEAMTRRGPLARIVDLDRLGDLCRRVAL